MGYFVKTVGSKVKIKKEYYDGIAFDKVCELNSKNELKRGGHYPANLEKPKCSKSNGNPNNWFSWMDWNYDETCENLTEVLEMLGFEVWDYAYDDEFYYLNLVYDNKMGQEKLFFEILAQYIEDGSYVNWVGEDDYLYRWKFNNGTIEVEEF